MRSIHAKQIYLVLGIDPLRVEHMCMGLPQKLKCDKFPLQSAVAQFALLNHTTSDVHNGEDLIEAQVDESYVTTHEVHHG